jgi:hypothetical protein
MSFLELRLPETSAPGQAGPSSTLPRPTQPWSRQALSLRLLLVGILVAPLVGLGAAGLAGYLAWASFADEDALMGWTNVVLLVLVLVLTGVGTWFLAVEYRMKRVQAGGGTA